MTNTREYVIVKEKDREGNYTGRVLILCRTCEKEFIKMEIKQMEDRIARYFPSLRKYRLKVVDLQASSERHFKKILDRI